MRIGFFDRSLSLLPFMKETAAAFPYTDLIYFADTLHVNIPASPTNISISVAIEYFQKKACDALVLGETIPVFTITENRQWKNGPRMLLVAPDLLHSYLESIATEDPEHTNVKGEKGERTIHLTQHSQAIDAEIARVLGGHFIAS